MRYTLALLIVASCGRVGFGRQDGGGSTDPGGDAFVTMCPNRAGAFRPRADYPLTSPAFAIAAHDFNRDGTPDLALLQGGVASVLLGSGGGMFHPPVGYAIGTGPSAIAARALDQTAPDLIVGTDVPPTVSVFAGNGDGTLGTRLDLVGVGEPAFVDVIDLDRDSRLDVITANYYDSSISVFRGNGDGTLQPAVHVVTNSTIGWARAVSAAFLDGDDHLDLVVAGDSINLVISVHLGTGQLGFGSERLFPVGYASTDLAIADLDRDGRLDVVVSNEQYGGISVLRGNGDGTLQSSVMYGGGGNAVDLVLADLDGDNNLDAVLATATLREINVLYGNGDATFQPERVFSTAATATSLAIADYDRDGTLDIAIANSDASTLSILFNGCMP